MEKMRPIGEVIKFARIVKGIKQTKLAKELKIKPQQFSRWESKKIIPDGETMVILMKLLDLKPEDFFTPEKKIGNFLEKESSNATTKI